MMRRMPTAVLLGAAAFALIALPGAQAAAVTVHISGALFQTTTVSIAASDTVVFVNDDSFAHDVTFEAGFGTGAAGSLAAGGNWSHQFNENGTFKFRCQTHSTNFDTGMVGKVQVGPTAAPPPKSPGFELFGVVAALGLVALLRVRPRRS
jgi:MYXO-CTERM domain-containing protein